MQLNRTDIVVLLVGLVILSLTAILNPNPLIFDERLFPKNVELLEQYGLGKEFLLKMEDQAPGPLYELIHLPLKGLTKLNARGLRTVNLILFYFIIVSLAYYSVRIQKLKAWQAFIVALHLVVIPTLWQVAALALTEVPAMLFAMLCMLLGSTILTESKNLSVMRILLLSAAMGFAQGLSVLGRTPYLVIAATFLLALLWQRLFLQEPNRTLPAFLPFLLIALSMTVPIFLLWNGLVPPLQAQVSGPIKPWHGLLSLGYTCIIGLLLNPYWFKFNKKIIITLALTFIAFWILNLMGMGYRYTPMSTTLRTVIGVEYSLIYRNLVSPLIGTLAVFFLICCYYKIVENRTNAAYLFNILSVLAILSTTVKISHQFSSRYVAQVAPFAIILFVNTFQNDKSRALRFAVGTILGLLSLNTYAALF